MDSYCIYNIETERTFQQDVEITKQRLAKMGSAHTSKSSSAHETTPTKANGSDNNSSNNNNGSSNGNDDQQSTLPPLPISVNIVDAPKTPAVTSPPVKSANSSTSLGKGDEMTSTTSSARSSGSRFSLKNLFKGKKKESNPILAAAASAPVNTSSSSLNPTPPSTPPVDERSSQQSTASKSKSRFSWGSSKKKNESS